MNFTIMCKDCKIWIHYACSGLPTYQILCFTKTNCKFTCEKCCLEKYEDLQWIKEANEAMDRQSKRKLIKDESTKYKNAETDTIDISTPDGPSQRTTEDAATEATDVNTGTNVDLGNSLIPGNPTQKGINKATTTHPASNVTNSNNEGAALTIENNTDNKPALPICKYCRITNITEPVEQCLILKH